MGWDTTNGLARHLLAANESQIAVLAPQLMDLVAADLGVPPQPVDHAWPADIVEATREFLSCVAADDLARIDEAGSVFEQVGGESARGGVHFDQLATAIRLAARRSQAQVYRAVIAEGGAQDTEVVLELLGRVIDGGDAIVRAARRGYELAALGVGKHDLGRRLASALIGNADHAEQLVVEAGWSRQGLVCAVITDVTGAVAIRGAADCLVAYYPRERDVVLLHPVDDRILSTTLRPLLADRARAVGPALPLEQVGQSLVLAQRAATLAEAGEGVRFADDVLLELTCSGDATVVAALRRKHFADMDELPADQREVLLATLRAWLLHWGHRPGIAEALGVHPQTVSGRINRLKDLLADDLDDPRVRSELLVLLIAESVADTGESRMHAAPTRVYRGAGGAGGADRRLV